MANKAQQLEKEYEQRDTFNAEQSLYKEGLYPGNVTKLEKDEGHLMLYDCLPGRIPYGKVDAENGPPPTQAQRLIAFFIQHPYEVYSVDEIRRSGVFGKETSAKNLRMVVIKARKLLPPGFYIENVPNEGYCLLTDNQSL